MHTPVYCNNQDNILTESSMSGLDKLTFEPNNKAKSAFVLQLHMQSPYELVLLLCSHVLVSLGCVDVIGVDDSCLDVVAVDMKVWGGGQVRSGQIRGGQMRYG
ncbi:hypothetical protein F2Q68_00025241 [Brassica cretica]|uniref:Uncharacterized protein n=1 Tax=Brassica cretica TaxID=69181 RepID=A0A8S9IGT6_BRACR|nr:hypothetical protein F2Q68_00025241 [Brassica cretica]